MRLVGDDFLEVNLIYQASDVLNAGPATAVRNRADNARPLHEIADELGSLCTGKCDVSELNVRQDILEVVVG